MDWCVNVCVSSQFGHQLHQRDAFDFSKLVFAEIGMSTFVDMLHPYNPAIGCNSYKQDWVERDGIR